MRNSYDISVIGKQNYVSRHGPWWLHNGSQLSRWGHYVVTNFGMAHEAIASMTSASGRAIKECSGALGQLSGAR